MRIYVAGRYGRKGELAKAAELLKKDGHEVTSRWLHHVDDGPPGRSEAIVDIQDVNCSEVLVLFTDPTGSKNMGGARFFEMGLAYAAMTDSRSVRMKAILFVGDPEIVFCFAPGVIPCATLEECLAKLREIESRYR